MTERVSGNNQVPNQPSISNNAEVRVPEKKEKLIFASRDNNPDGIIDKDEMGFSEADILLDGFSSSFKNNLTEDKMAKVKAEYNKLANQFAGFSYTQYESIDGGIMDNQLKQVIDLGVENRVRLEKSKLQRQAFSIVEGMMSEPPASTGGGSSVGSTPVESSEDAEDVSGAGEASGASGTSGTSPSDSADRPTIDFGNLNTRVSLGGWSTANRLKGEDLTNMIELINKGEVKTPEDMLNKYIAGHAPTGKDGNQHTSLSDFDSRLLDEFLAKNPSVFKDGKIAINAKLEKCDFPSSSQLAGYLKAEFRPDDIGGGDGGSGGGSVDDGGSVGGGSTPPAVDDATVEKLEQAEELGLEIYNYAVGVGTTEAEIKGMSDTIKNKVKKDNVVEVWLKYSSVGSDSSILDTYGSEWLSKNDRKNAAEATIHLIKAMVDRAKSAGLTSSPTVKKAESACKKIEKNYQAWASGDMHLNGKKSPWYDKTTDRELQEIAEATMNALAVEIDAAEGGKIASALSGPDDSDLAVVEEEFDTEELPTEET